jgi:YVTN family beta-propeller protein
MTEKLRDRYELLDVLGKGGEGKVLKAIDHLHGRMVAIKVRSAASAELRDTLLQEARTLLDLEPHRGLSVVRDDFFVDDGYYMVMDWIEGENLQRVLEKSGDPGLPYETVLEYLSEIAGALDHLHAQDPPVMHLDVKPANLILMDRRRVVLVDFGIASSSTARSGAGTSGYVAPELAGGDAPTPAADVYGLAATAHALLTGSPPRGKSPVWKGVPADQLHTVKQTLERALAIDPARRPRSASALVEELRAQTSPADEEKAPVAPAKQPPGESRHEERRAGTRLRTVVAIAFGLAGLAAVLLITSPWRSDALERVPHNSVGRIDVDSHAIEAAVAVGIQPTRVVVGEGAVWVSNLEDKTVSRIDPASDTVERVIASGGTPTDVAVGEGAVWVANEFEGTVAKVDPSTNAPTRNAELSPGCRDIAVGEGALWVTNVTDETLTKIDPTSLEILDSVHLPGKPEDVAIGYDAVWIADSSNRTLLRVDPSTLRIERIGLRSSATSVATGERAVWTTSAGEDLVTRVDPDSSSTETIRVGNSPVEIAARNGSGVWVTNYLDGDVSHIDPVTRRVVETVPVGNSPEGIATDGETVWVTVHPR